MTAAGKWKLNFQVNSISKKTRKTLYVGGRNVGIRSFPESAAMGVKMRLLTCQATNVLALLAVQNCDLILCKKYPNLLSGSSMIFRKPPE